MPRVVHKLLVLAVATFVTGIDDQESPTYELSNGLHIPFVGMGIGNLQHDLIDDVVSNSLQPDLNIQLIDTAHASRNEAILAKAIFKTDQQMRRSRNTRLNKSEPLPPIHIVTKIWYTYLGYERTKISVQETLDELSSVGTRQVYIHMLLHWPRCNDEIEWMNCIQEEHELPQHVKDAGPPPHLKKDAWKDSWKALEDVYEEFAMARKIDEKEVKRPIIASIGVSNFDFNDMRALKDIAKVQPHIYQGDVWKVFHDPDLLRHIRGNNIFFQAYGVMDRVMGGRGDAPSAFSVLSDVTRKIATTLDGLGNYHDKSLAVTEATIILAYCVDNGIGVIPRASSAHHRKENSPKTISTVIPHLTSTHLSQIQLAMPALMRGEELHASISFMNSLPGPIQIHWIHSESGEEVLVKEILETGAVEVIKSHPGHRFVAYDTERQVKREVSVDVGYGERQHFAVEL